MNNRRRNGVIRLVYVYWREEEIGHFSMKSLKVNITKKIIEYMNEVECSRISGSTSACLDINHGHRNIPWEGFTIYVSGGSARILYVGR